MNDVIKKDFFLLSRIDDNIGADRSYVFLDTGPEKKLLVGGPGPRKQTEDIIFRREWAMAVQIYAFWPL
jgi:hypothetical protein